MGFVVGCSDPAGLPSFDVGGAVVCSMGVPAMVEVSPGLGSLSSADVLDLLSASLAVVAMAWGFRVVGSLIYRDRG